MKGLCYSSNKTQEFELVTSSVSNEYRVMDYDFQEREIYSIDSDSNNIVKINSVSKDQSVVYTSSLKGFDVESLGLDWITKNLYFFYDGILKVLDLKDKSKPPKSLLTFDHYLAEVKVFPDEGYLVVKVSCKLLHFVILCSIKINYLIDYFCLTDNSVTRINADGTNPVSLYTNNAITIHTMALDHFKQDVYWLEENFSGKLKIRYVNLYGSEVKTFEVKDGPANDYNLNYLAIDQDYVYFIRNINYNETFEYHQNSLTRASKVDGVWDKEFGLMADIEKGTQKYGDEFINILMLRSYPEKINKGHPCLNNNGGCPSYCFGVPDENKKLTKKCTD